MECTFIAAGIIFVLGIVSLRQDDRVPSALAVSLAALKDWTFLLGPGFIVGWGNGLILGYLMYSSRLVPREMAWLGLVGGPLIILFGIGTLFDAWDAGSTVPAITVIPEFLWELSLGIYCSVKGFRARFSDSLAGRAFDTAGRCLTRPPALGRESPRVHSRSGRSIGAGASTPRVPPGLYDLRGSPVFGVATPGQARHPDGQENDACNEERPGARQSKSEHGGGCR